MLTEAQVAVLCDIAQSIAFADDMHGEVDRLIKEGYVAKDGDLYELTPKAQKVLSDRGAGLNEARCRRLAGSGGPLDRPSGYGRRIEQREIVVDAPMVGPDLLAAARDVQNQAKQFPAGFFDRHFAGRDAASVEVDQVFPAPRQFAAGGDLDDRRGRKPVRRAAAGGENLQGHAGGELKRAADEIGCRRCREQHTLLPRFLARSEHAGDRA